MKDRVYIPPRLEGSIELTLALAITTLLILLSIVPVAYAQEENPFRGMTGDQAARLVYEMSPGDIVDGIPICYQDGSTRRIDGIPRESEQRVDQEDADEVIKKSIALAFRLYYPFLEYNLATGCPRSTENPADFEIMVEVSTLTRGSSIAESGGFLVTNYDDDGNPIPIVTRYLYLDPTRLNWIKELTEDELQEILSIAEEENISDIVTALRNYSEFFSLVFATGHEIGHRFNMEHIPQAFASCEPSTVSTVMFYAEPTQGSMPTSLTLEDIAEFIAKNPEMINYEPFIEYLNTVMQHCES